MTTNKKDIRRWLDLYMEGKTSLKEEDLLREYFRSQHVDKEFADFKAMFNQFDKGEPSFMEEELNAWLQSCQPEEYSNYSDTPSGPPQQPDHRHGTKRIVIRWMTAASIATVFFLLGFTLSQKESTSSVVSTPTSPTVLTQIKWKTDTLFSEKPMPAEPTTIVITVRDTIVLEAGYRDEPMRADHRTRLGRYAHVPRCHARFKHGSPTTNHARLDRHPSRIRHAKEKNERFFPTV